jgi:hypothetical protein
VECAAAGSKRMREHNETDSPFFFSPALLHPLLSPPADIYKRHRRLFVKIDLLQTPTTLHRLFLPLPLNLAEKNDETALVASPRPAPLSTAQDAYRDVHTTQQPDLHLSEPNSSTPSCCLILHFSLSLPLKMVAGPLRSRAVPANATAHQMSFQQMAEDARRISKRANPDEGPSSRSSRLEEAS